MSSQTGQTGRRPVEQRKQGPTGCLATSRATLGSRDGTSVLPEPFSKPHCRKQFSRRSPTELECSAAAWPRLQAATARLLCCHIGCITRVRVRLRLRRPFAVAGERHERKHWLRAQTQLAETASSVFRRIDGRRIPASRIRGCIPWPTVSTVPTVPHLAAASLAWDGMGWAWDGHMQA
jgi:hypothetical protein